jgi:hypothetical protein
MSDDSESTTRPPQKQTRMPPVFLLGGFLMVATAGSAFFVVPGEEQKVNFSYTVILPNGKAYNSNIFPSTAGEKSPPQPSPRDQVTLSSEPTTEKPDTDPEEERLRQLIVGDWQQDYYGERALSIKADGTATMTILPSSFFTVAFGTKIDLTMFWSVKDGHLDYGINGGSPEDKVKLAARTWGDHWVEKIIELDETKLDLLSVDGSTHSIWKRVSRKFDPEAELKSAD